MAAGIATGPDALRIEWVDGRMQDITIQNLDGSGENLAVSVTERKDGHIARTETTVK